MGDPSITALEDPTLMRAQQRVGSVLRGKRHLDLLLGVGAMAAVYGARHRNGKCGAIKMLRVEVSLDDQIPERFLREGRAANQVGHPAAVSVLDDDEAEDGAIFLVMGLLEGEILKRRRERVGGKMHVVDVISIVDQALRRARSGARAGHRSSGHQARQPARHARRHGEDARLRNRTPSRERVFEGHAHPDLARTPRIASDKSKTP